MTTATTKLVFGSWVHCILYGGKDGVIFEIHGEQRPETVSSVCRGVGVMGGSADFDIVWEDGTESKRTPEALIIGSVQWEVLDQPPATAETVAFMRAFAAHERERKAIDAKAAQAKFDAEVAALRINPAYTHLDQGVGMYGNCGKLAAANIRREVKRIWPTVKFSVKKNHHSSISVNWVDGPTTDEVKAVTRKYSGGPFHGMDDIYEPSRSPWTSVFGSSDYISESRRHSVEAMTAAVAAVCEECGWDLLKIDLHSDGAAYLNGWGHDEKSRRVYDWLERRHEYEKQEPQPGDAEYEQLKAKVVAMEAKAARHAA